MILVLGATGFLGKRVCRKLEELKFEYKKTSLSLGVDLRDPAQTEKLFESTRPTKVLNCASYVGGIQFGYKHPAELFTNNLKICVNILECCKKFGVARLINPISNCVYPAAATLFKEDEIWNGPLHESVATYGFVRKAFLVGSHAFAVQHGLDIINVVLSNMYGPEDHFEEERSHALGALLMKFFRAKKENLPEVEVWGTGKPVREWLHVDDGAEAMIRAMDIAPYDGPINIGVAKGISIEDMAEMIKDEVGYTGKIRYNADKPDGAVYKTVDGSLGRQLFGGWTPSTDFSQGLKDTVAWYIQNKGY